METLEDIKKSGIKRVFVVACQRSGTHFVTHVIAKLLGVKAIYEHHFNADNEDMLRPILEDNTKGYVIQCPALSHCIHKYSEWNNMIVFVRRNYADIIASQKAMKWSFEEYELNKYGCPNIKYTLPIAKLAAWKYQKLLCKNAITLQYESLSEHEDWRKEKYDDIALLD